YNYYAEIVPREYPIVKPFMVFLPSGNRAKGLEQLNTAAERSKYARTEATYFLVQNYFLHEKNFQKAADLAEGLSQKYPRNPAFLRYRGRCLVSLGRWDEAFKVFSRVVDLFKKGQVGFNGQDAREGYYYRGKYYFTNVKYDDALENFRESERLSYDVDKDVESGFLSMTVLHIGMIYDVTNHRADAVRQYRRVLAMKEYEQTHRDARRFLETPYKGSTQ
ncbi:MAG: tetratricopeptide repeat protein, partial [Ignavibacteriales bacterium]|nr:tetratricopeptide repeat protein [Ignavibacteriales bacterium]